MGLLDFFMFLVITLVLFLLCKQLSKACKPEHRKIIMIAFWARVFSSLCYSLFWLVARGDTVDLYFPEAYNFYKLILSNPSNTYLLFQQAHEFDENLLYFNHNLGYLTMENNYMVVRIASVICFFTFGRLMATNLVFAMLAFSGAWKLFVFFEEQFPNLRKQLAIAILFLPTFLFWSSGILKDTLCVGALGWFTYSLYHLFYAKRKMLLNFLIVLFTAWLLYILKIYILLSFLPAIAIYLALLNVGLIKNALLKVVVVLLFFSLGLFGFMRMSETMEKGIGGFAKEGIEERIMDLQDSYKIQQNRGGKGSFFSLGVTYDGSLLSLLKIAPAAINATLFRPYIWESKKISTLLSSIESLVLMLFTLSVLLRCGLKAFFKTIINKSAVLFCFIFSISFALFVGASTLNFGTLVRYKIPCMPFYVIMLFLILYYNDKLEKRKKKKPAIAKEHSLPLQNA